MYNYLQYFIKLNRIYKESILSEEQTGIFYDFYQFLEKECTKYVFYS